MDTEQSLKGYSCWLDPIIRQQAAHYGLTVDQHAKLMSGASATQEAIDLHEVTEEEARGVAK
jgi:DNA-nicking Smr family endonuclease